MVEIVKVYRESLPNLRLIGKRYTEADRDEYGGFSVAWGKWFENDWFSPLEKLGSLPEAEGAYMGCMRCIDEFEYWIGMFFPEGTQVPDGYMYIDIPSGNIGTCWIYGSEDNGEIFGQEIYSMCVSEIIDRGWKLSKNPWVFERYNCPRYTTRDEKGKVILDYCIYLQDS